MKSLARTLAAVLLSAATVVAPLSVAQAGDQLGGDSDPMYRNKGNNYYVIRDHRNRNGHWRRDWRHHPRVIYRDRSNNAAAAAIIGLGAAAIIGGAIANSNRHVAPPRHYRVAPTSARGYEPWSQGWYRYCANRYRSFNPATGTFRGYDGRDHFCVAN